MMSSAVGMAGSGAACFPAVSARSCSPSWSPRRQPKRSDLFRLKYVHSMTPERSQPHIAEPWQLCRCSASDSLSERPHVQLATAKLPKGVDAKQLGSKLYQWASTLTYQGRNMPFALPFRTNPLDTGFELSLLRINSSGRPVSIGDVVATVEQEADVGDVLFVRFYDTPDSAMDRRTPLPSDEKERLRLALAACVDVPIIMNSLPNAIRDAVKQVKA